jgi:hypothetical protein
MDPTTLIIEHAAYLMKPYIKERVKEEVGRLEKEFSNKDPEQFGVLEHTAREALGPEKYRQRQQQQAEERRQDVFEYLSSAFLVYLRAYLDSGIDGQVLLIVLP